MTANQADVQVFLRDNKDGRRLEQCFLLTVRSEALERKGSWWVVEETPVGATVARSASVRLIDSGQAISQPGYLVGLWGPYSRSTPTTWDYWFYRRGYQPEDLIDRRVTNRSEADKPVTIMMLRVDPGRAYSDEQTLDGARRLVEVADLLPDSLPEAQLLNLVIDQLDELLLKSYRTEDKQAADELRQAIRDRLTAMPAELRGASPPPAPYE